LQDIDQYNDHVTDWVNGIQFPAGAGNFSPCHHIQAGSGTLPASCLVITRVLSHLVKRLGCEAAKVKNVWSYASMSWCGT